MAVLYELTKLFILAVTPAMSLVTVRVVELPPSLSRLRVTPGITSLTLFEVRVIAIPSTVKLDGCPSR